jgi:hypothetical protein
VRLVLVDLDQWALARRLVLRVPVDHRAQVARGEPDSEGRALVVPLPVLRPDPAVVDPRDVALADLVARSAKSRAADAATSKSSSRLK